MSRLTWLRAGWFVLLLVGCGSGGGSTASKLQTVVLPPLAVEAAFPALSFSAPVFITHAGDGTNRLFVVEQAGRIWVFRNDATVTNKELFLDISTRVTVDGEQGLLGLAFDPDFENNRHFYVYYSIASPHQSVISRFTASSDPNMADIASEVVLLSVDQPPFSNHKAGMLAFSPIDNKLYIATGDGGSGNDPNKNAQNLNTALGKILRINTDGSIPLDNPFANDPNTRGEIWAYGLRNPFRMSFDRATGRLWAGDVGQSAREEVDIIEKGGNYGWRTYEGNLLTGLDPMTVPAESFVFPVLDYGRDVGTTVIGGYVYRGPGLPAYQGAYIYGDFGSGRVWALIYDAIAERVVSNTEVATLTLPSSFGEDEAGELYVTSFDGSIYRFRQP